MVIATAGAHDSVLPCKSKGLFGRNGIVIGMKRLDAHQTCLNKFGDSPPRVHLLGMCEHGHAALFASSPHNCKCVGIGNVTLGNTAVFK